MNFHVDYPYKYPRDPIEAPVTITEHSVNLNNTNSEQDARIQQIKDVWEPDYKGWYKMYLLEPAMIKKAWYYSLFERSQWLMWCEVYKVIEPDRRVPYYPLDHWDPEDYATARDVALELHPSHPLFKDFDRFEEEWEERIARAMYESMHDQDEQDTSDEEMGAPPIANSTNPNEGD